MLTSGVRCQWALRGRLPSRRGCHPLGALGTGSWGSAACGRPARPGARRPAPFLAHRSPAVVVVAKSPCSRMMGEPPCTYSLDPCVHTLGSLTRGAFCQGPMSDAGSCAVCPCGDDSGAPFCRAIDGEPEGRDGLVSPDAGGMCPESDRGSSHPDSGQSRRRAMLAHGGDAPTTLVTLGVSDG